MTYCIEPNSRSQVGSITISIQNAAIERIFCRNNLYYNNFSEGVKEIWLTSEDLGAYGRDLNVTLSELLRKMVKVIPDGCMLRLGMANPPYILDYLEVKFAWSPCSTSPGGSIFFTFQDIADILNHPKVYCFLHIPVQSGSDAVLSDMKREYNCASFRRVVDYMLQKLVTLRYISC